MKKFNTNSLVSMVMVTVLVFSFMFSLLAVPVAQAATAPVLGTASGYSVFGNAGVTNNSTVGTTHVWGNVGGNGVPSGTGVTNLDDATQVDGAIDAGANASVVGAISTAYGDLADEVQTGAIDLALSPTVTPGVYDIAATAFNSTLTLNGDGVYIFRSTSSIARTAGGTMILNGATACNVFWQIPTAMTFATGVGSIYGTIITNTGEITFADTGVTLQGRAWAATQVTMINTVITEPTCAGATPTPTPSSSSGSSVPPTSTLTVTKIVINDSGRTKVVADFPLFVTVIGNTMPVISGVPNTFTSPAPPYIVSETTDPNYTRTFSGDCDVNGYVAHNPGDINFCIVTNNDIGAPLPIAPPSLTL